MIIEPNKLIGKIEFKNVENENIDKIVKILSDTFRTDTWKVKYTYFDDPRALYKNFYVFKKPKEDEYLAINGWREITISNLFKTKEYISNSIISGGTVVPIKYRKKGLSKALFKSSWGIYLSHEYDCCFGFSSHYLWDNFYRKIGFCTKPTTSILIYRWMPNKHKGIKKLLYRVLCVLRNIQYSYFRRKKPKMDKITIKQVHRDDNAIIERLDQLYINHCLENKFGWVKRNIDVMKHIVTRKKCYYFVDRKNIIGYMIAVIFKNKLLISELIISSDTGYHDVYNFIHKLCLKQDLNQVELHGDNKWLFLTKKKYDYDVDKKSFWSLLKPFEGFFKALKLNDATIQIYDQFLEQEYTIGKGMGFVCRANHTDIVDFLWGNINNDEIIKRIETSHSLLECKQFFNEFLTDNRINNLYFTKEEIY